MAAIFAMKYRETEPAIFTINGVSIDQLGGRLRREGTAGTGGDADSRSDCGRVIQIYNKVFCCHTSSTSNSRIYEFDGDAFFSNISGLSGLFVAGETITGGTSGATATVTDATVAGDTFIIITPVSGTFQVSETITGGTSGATATLDSLPAQGGAVGSEGEWKVAHTISFTLAGFLAHTGLYAVNDNNKLKIVGLYVDNSNSLRSLKYDPDLDTWTESTGLIATGGGVNEFGRVSTIGESLIWKFDSSTGNTLATLTYNPTTNSASIQTFSVSNNSEGQFGLGRPIVEWLGRIFLHTKQAGNNDGLELFELSGGSWAQVLSFTGGTSGGQTEWEVFDSGGGMFIPDGNSLYLFTVCDLNGGGGGRGFTCTKFTNINGTITCDNVETTGTVTDTHTPKMAQFLLPASLAVGLATLVGDAEDPRWRIYLDDETNDPDGNKIYTIWFCPQHGSTAADAFTWDIKEDISDQPGVTYTWNGSTTVTYSPTTSTVVADLDWISLKSDGQMFRVSGTPSGGNITIENPHSLTIPSGSSTSVILKAFTSVGSVSGTGQYAFSDEIMSGGNRTFVKGELDMAITQVSQVVGGERIKFKLFSTSGSTTVDVEFFFGPAGNGSPDTQCTLSNPSAGSLNGNTIENLTADNGATEYEVTWEALTDGAVNGEIRRIVGKTFV